MAASPKTPVQASATSELPAPAPASSFWPSFIVESESSPGNIKLDVAKFDELYEWEGNIPYLPFPYTLPIYAKYLEASNAASPQDLARLHFIPEYVPVPGLFVAVYSPLRKVKAVDAAAKKLSEEAGPDPTSIGKIVSTYTLFVHYGALFTFFANLTVEDKTAQAMMLARAKTVRDALAEAQKKEALEFRTGIKKVFMKEKGWFKCIEDPGYVFARMDPTNKVQREVAQAYRQRVRMYMVRMIRLREAAVLQLMGIREKTGHKGSIDQLLCRVDWPKELIDTIEQENREFSAAEEVGWATSVNQWVQQKSEDMKAHSKTASNKNIGPNGNVENQLEPQAINVEDIILSRGSNPEGYVLGWFTYYQAAEMACVDFTRAYYKRSLPSVISSTAAAASAYEKTKEAGQGEVKP